MLSTNGSLVWNNPCTNIKKFPLKTGPGSNGVVLNSSILICGGKLLNNACKSLGKSGSWHGAPSMTQGRRFHAMATINESAIIVGGKDRYGNPLFSSEMYVNGSFKNIKDLPFQAHGSCITQLNEHELILSGGKQNSLVSKSLRQYI